MLLYIKKLEGDYLNAVRSLVVEYGDDFVPSLKDRSSTLQVNFSDDNVTDDSIESYLDSLLKQEFILLLLNNQLAGFMSFIRNKEITLYENKHVSHYISTVIIKNEFRGKGHLIDIYEFLFEVLGNADYCTRTWSTNKRHLSVLKKLGFVDVKSIKDDRGTGVDTVYYYLNGTG